MLRNVRPERMHCAVLSRNNAHHRKSPSHNGCAKQSDDISSEFRDRLQCSFCHKQRSKGLQHLFGDIGNLSGPLLSSRIAAITNIDLHFQIVSWADFQFSGVTFSGVTFSFQFFALSVVSYRVLSADILIFRTHSQQQSHVFNSDIAQQN